MPKKKDTRFQPGHARSGGAISGQKYRTSMTRRLNECLITAMEKVGRDTEGKDGLVGYFMRVAIEDCGVFCRLVEKIMPPNFHEKNADGQTGDITIYETRDDVIIELKKRGLPTPPRLLDITPLVTEAAPRITPPPRDGGMREDE